MKTDFPDSPPPAEIEARSFAIIDSEVPEPRPFQGSEWEVARRLVHTSADFELLGNIRFHPKAIESGMAALRRGCRIVTDTEMARVGIPVRRLDPLGATALCLLNEPGTASLARERGADSDGCGSGRGPGRALQVFAHGSAWEHNGNWQRAHGPAAVAAAVAGQPRGPTPLPDHWHARGICERGGVQGVPHAAGGNPPTSLFRGARGAPPLAAATCNALAVMALRK